MLFFTKLRIANWRQLAPRDENQVGANLAPMAMVILFFTQLRIANWRCRQLAPIVGANWRQLRIANILAPIGAAHRQIGANWRQSLAPIGAKLAPIGAQDLKFPFTEMYPFPLYQYLTIIGSLSISPSHSPS